MIWQIEAVCAIGRDTAECTFFAKTTKPVRKPEREWGWLLDINNLFLEVENDDPLDEVRDAIEQKNHEWLLCGFMRLYVQRFRRHIRQNRDVMQIGADELVAFVPPVKSTAIEDVMREIEDLCFELAYIGTLLEEEDEDEDDDEDGIDWSLMGPALDWDKHRQHLETDASPVVRSMYPEITRFHQTFSALIVSAASPEPPEKSHILNRITRLQLQGAQMVWAYEDALREAAAAGTRGSEAEFPYAVPGQIQDPLRIAAVELRDIRCFSHLRLDLGTEGQPVDWLLIVGDNARGKSSLLRAIALGLCNEADAAALLKAIPGRMLRKEAREGSIELSLVDGNGATFSIRTDIQVQTDARTEVLRRTTSPQQGFPWERIFVCAYGPQRTRHAQSSYERYAALNAVRSLFDYEADLQNPEVILLRQSSEARVRMERKLRQILMLDGEHGGIDYSDSGIALWGPWGKLPLGSLSDGYRSTFQWVLDLIGWLIYAGRFERDEDMAGIVLIDELEQHLHPRWQRYIIAQIHQQFPGIQFITSTHTPLVAAGIADIDNAMLIALEEDENGATTAQPIDPRSLRGQRADQVLTSRAFGLTTSRSPGSADDIARYAELAGKERTPDEEEEHRELARTLETSLALGETPVEQTVEHAVRKTLDDMLNAAPDKTTELELKKQLRALFRDGEPS